MHNKAGILMFTDITRMHTVRKFSPWKLSFLFFYFVLLVGCIPIGFTIQWRNEALVGRQTYRLRLRPGHRPCGSRDACTVFNIALYRTFKGSPNYIILSYSMDILFLFHPLPFFIFSFVHFCAEILQINKWINK